VPGKTHRKALGEGDRKSGSTDVFFLEDITVIEIDLVFAEQKPGSYRPLRGLKWDYSFFRFQGLAPLATPYRRHAAW
jgi:hypothetical protein